MAVTGSVAHRMLHDLAEDPSLQALCDKRLRKSFLWTNRERQFLLDNPNLSLKELQAQLFLQCQVQRPLEGIKKTLRKIQKESQTAEERPNDRVRRSHEKISTNPKWTSERCQALQEIYNELNPGNRAQFIRNGGWEEVAKRANEAFSTQFTASYCQRMIRDIKKGRVGASTELIK